MHYNKKRSDYVAKTNKSLCCCNITRETPKVTSESKNFFKENSTHTAKGLAIHGADADKPGKTVAKWTKGIKIRKNIYS